MFKRTELSKQIKLINLCLNVIIHITEYSPKPPLKLDDKLRLI